MKMEKDGEDIVRVWVGLNTIEELPSEKPYRLVLRVVVPSETWEDDTKEQRALSVVSEMRRLLAQCEGVEVEDANLATESDITQERPPGTQTRNRALHKFPLAHPPALLL
jgi:hypothetical protein